MDYKWYNLGEGWCRIMQELANKIDKELNKLDFDRLFPSFVKIPFALYHDGLLFYPKKIVPYEHKVNEAIVNYDKEEPFAITVANVVREMFVQYLNRACPRHYPNEMNILNYPENFLNYDYMAYEKKLLLKSYNTKDLNEKLNYLRMFMNVRHVRESIIGNAIYLEFKVETTTGLANYIFLKVLKLFNSRLYTQYIHEAIHTMDFYQRSYFDLRHYNYFVGCLVLLILDELKIYISIYDLKQRTIFETMRGKIEYIEEMISYVPTKNLINNLKHYKNEVKNLFLDFYAYKIKKVGGKFRIVVLDPNSIIKYENQIFHQKFVCLEDLNGKSFLVQGPVITKMDDENNVITYFVKI